MARSASQGRKPKQNKNKFKKKKKGKGGLPKDVPHTDPKVDVSEEPSKTSEAMNEKSESKEDPPKPVEIKEGPDE
uniref:Uncharacterized protein n=1 Tax=Lepeophtheirus salmonis TaxID=72036 RepID=A0A0K2SV60_LEPSM